MYSSCKCCAGVTDKPETIGLSTARLRLAWLLAHEGRQLAHGGRQLSHEGGHTCVCAPWLSSGSVSAPAAAPRVYRRAYHTH